MKKLLQVLGIVFMLIIILALVANFFDGSKSKKVTVPVGIDSTKTLNLGPVSSWAYSTDEDKMTSKNSYYAGITASEELNLKFPYSGGVIASLNIRKKDGESNVYLKLSKGQLMAAHTLDDGSIRMRFDNNEPETYSVSGAADGSSNTVFINSANKVISKLKKAKKLIIEAEVFDNGTQQMEFTVSGFLWSH